MYYYKAYNLHIHSELLLPELELAEKSPPDVVIRRQTLDSAMLAEADGGDCFAGEVRDVATAVVEEGRTILIDPLPGVDEDVIRTSILGPFFAVLLRQRGLLALHASCVVLDGAGAVAFIGEKGWGKSTLAGAFYAQGCSVVSDDIVPVDLSAPHPMVIPSYPQLKLLPDAARSLAGDADDFSLPESLTAKLVHRVEREFPRSAVPLRRVYLLGIGEEHAIEPVDDQTAFRALARHTRATKSLKTKKYVATHFHQCTDLARRISISHLKRKPSLTALPEVVELIRKDLADECVEEPSG